MIEIISRDEQKASEHPARSDDLRRLALDASFDCVAETHATPLRMLPEKLQD